MVVGGSGRQSRAARLGAVLGHVSDDEGGNEGTGRRPSNRKACLRALTALVWQHVAQWSLGRPVAVGCGSTRSFPFPIQASLTAGERVIVRLRIGWKRCALRSAPKALSLSHIRILRHAPHNLGRVCTEAARKTTLLFITQGQRHIPQARVVPSGILCFLLPHRL